MASKSKFLPYVALGVALAFLSCYPLATLGFAGAATGSSQVQIEESAPFGILQTNAKISFCEACQAVAAKTVKPDLPAAGYIGIPVNLSSEAAVEPIVLFPPTADPVFSKRFALHRSSLFNQAILIRI